MKEIITSGDICLDDEYDFIYCVAKIRYVEREDESYYYEIIPNYSVIDLLTPKDFQGIPGLDLDMRKEVYVRENMVPTFISERSPGENREDLWVLLEACDMKYLNRLEWLVRTDSRYSGDKLYVCRLDREDIQTISIDQLGNRSSVISRKILEAICEGSKVITSDFTIDDSNRKAYYELFMALYRTERKYIDERRREGVQKSAKQGNYIGRSRIKIDVLEMQEIFQDYETGKMNGREAAKKLGISPSTFFRRYREYKEQCTME